MNAAVRPFGAPVPAGVPPLDQEGLERLLRKVREWEPVDWAGVFDDLSVVLGDDFGHHAQADMPGDDRAEELAQHFRGALIQLVNRAQSDDVPERYPDTVSLIEQARAVRSRDLPRDPWRALGVLRRMGWTTLNLFERLAEVGCIEDVVEC